MTEMLIIGSELTSDRQHQCVLCLDSVEIGDPVKSAAYDMLTNGMVWTHAHCADDWHRDGNSRIMHMLSNGWETLDGAQACFLCKNDMRQGSRAYRLINPVWRRYDRVCKLCWLKKMMA